MVLDNEALGQIAGGQPARSILVALEVAAVTSGRVVLPACVMVERCHDPTAARAARTNRVLRTAGVDELTRARAVDAARLRRSCPGSSVVDAHVAAAALAVVGRHGGTATVATSDPGDIARLLDATDDATDRMSVSVQPL